MIKKINRNIYLDLAQNGARELCEIANYQILDGLKDEEQSYFIIDIEDQEYYQIDLRTCYELVTMKYGNVKEEYILEYLAELSFELE